MSSRIRLRRSHRIEDLLDALGDDLERDRLGGASPLRAVRLVLPSRTLDAWLRLSIARRDGIAANLVTCHQQAFIADVLASTLPSIGLLGRDRILARLINLFHDDTVLAAPAVQPVREYLDSAGVDTDARDRRRAQLAAQLEQLLDEYSLTRPQLLRSWLGDDAPEETGPRAWQRELWRLVAGAAAKEQRPLVDIASAVAMLPEHAGRLAAEVPAVHVFGFAHLPALVLELLGHLAAVSTVRVYVLAPRELDREPDGPARWTRPARDGVSMIGAALGIAPEPVTATVTSPQPPSLLQVLQNAISGDGQPDGAAEGAPHIDESVLVLAAPSPRREMEAVAAEIWRRLRRDPGLLLPQIGVVLPAAAREALAPEVEAVFREQRLPSRVVDSTLREQATVHQAIDLLLALPLGELTRPDVLRLVSHPSFMARFPGIEPDRWFELCDRMGVIRGAGREDNGATYLEHDVISWEQGVRRLALGALLAPSPSGAPPSFHVLDGTRHLPVELSPGRRDEALCFARVIRSLLADAAHALLPRPLAQHFAVMRALVDTYLGTTSDSTSGSSGNDDQEALEEVRRTLVRLQHLGADQEVSYRVAFELARRALGGSPGVHGAYGDGVVISSYLGVRGIPFRLLFLCGLDEGVFPASEPPRPLDVRTGEPLPGDVGPRESDMLLFAEAIQSARGALVLSYRARDPLTGERLEPSPAVSEVLEHLEEHLADAQASSRLTRHIPLHRWNDAQAASESPLAGGDRDAHALAERLRASRAGVDLQVLRTAAPPGLTAALGLPPAPERVERDPNASVAITVPTLTAFLVCPPQGWARALLRMHTPADIDDVVARDEELLTSSHLDGATLRRDAWLLAARRRQSSLPTDEQLASAYDELMGIEQLAGRAPGGPFGAAERARDLDILRNWTAQLAAVSGHVPPQVLAFGQGGHGPSTDESLPPLQLQATGREGIIELHGRTQILQRRSGDQPLSVSSTLAFSTSDGDPAKQRALLNAFVDHLLLAAAGSGAPDGHRLILCRAGSKPLVQTWRALSATQARANLSVLLGDMLTEAPPWYLPFAAVVRLHDEPTLRVADVLSELRERQVFDGPLPSPEQVGLPSDEEARRIVAGRLAPFFDLQAEVDE